MSLEFNQFFKRQRLSSTYKPMLAKCLLDLGDYDKNEGGQWVKKDEDVYTINLHFLAARFLRYYHPLRFKFKLKQEATKETVAIYKILTEHKHLFEKLRRKYTPTKEEMCSELFHEMREKTIKHPLMRVQVLPKLRKDCNIYEISEDKKYIKIRKYVVDYIQSNKNILEASLNHMISVYLETCNAAPSISTKMIEGLNRKNLSSKLKEEILKISNNTCFYCPANNVEFDMDHFIPWNYLGQTEQYNMVPACKHCNTSKNDKLTIKKYLNDLIERNKKLKKLPMGYSEEFLANMYENSIVEYHGKNRKLWRNVENIV